MATESVSLSYGWLHEARAGAADAIPEEIERIREKARRHISELRTWADRMEQRWGKDVFPGNPSRLRGFAGQTEERMSEHAEK